MPNELYTNNGNLPEGFNDHEPLRGGKPTKDEDRDFHWEEEQKITPEERKEFKKRRRWEN